MPPTPQPDLPLIREQALASPEQVRQDVDAALAHFFEAELTKAEQIGATYAELWRAMQELVLSGGKRFRPYLTVLGYQACRGDSYAKILPVAMGQELLHAGLLIHDDIIDRDFVRYGRDNVSGAFRKKYRHLADEPTATHYAHSAALLAGDLALSAAHQQLLLADLPSARKQSAMALFATGMFEVIGGELLDTEASLHDPGTVDSLAIAQHKTASYSIVAPLCIGAVLAEADTATVQSLQRLGKPLGIAYQLADDMLGLFGDEAVTGKPILSDIREGKRTYIMQMILQKATSDDRDHILQLLGNPMAGREDLNTVRTIAERSGAQAHVVKKIATYEQEALAELTSLPFTPEVTEALRQFIAKALRRNA